MNNNLIETMRDNNDVQFEIPKIDIEFRIPDFNKGINISIKLQEYYKHSMIKKTQLAGMLNVSTQRLWEWLHGKPIVKIETMHRLLALPNTNFTIKDFL